MIKVEELLLSGPVPPPPPRSKAKGLLLGKVPLLIAGDGAGVCLGLFLKKPHLFVPGTSMAILGEMI